MIKAWEFDFNAAPGKSNPDYDNQEIIQRAFDFNKGMMESLERRGFEGVFYSEHHFINSLSPCPNLLVAMLAAKTSRLKIGVMGNVLPFHQPWRLAEELSMLDYITNGRLEIGVASGVPPEFLFVNIPQPDIRPMYTEVLDFLEKANNQRYVTQSGKFFSFDNVPIMPRPRKEMRRRHWMTIYSDVSCRDAARRNFKICTGYQSVEAAALAFDAYRDEADKLGQEVGPDDIGIRRQVLLSDSDIGAQELAAELQESARARMADTFKAVDERLNRAGVGMAPGVKETGVMDAAAVQREPVKSVNPFKASKGLVISPDEFITGSPQTVAEQIIHQCQRAGAGNIMAYHSPTMDETQIERNYALWEKVIPILHKADVTKQAA